MRLARFSTPDPQELARAGRGTAIIHMGGEADGRDPHPRAQAKALSGRGLRRFPPPGASLFPSIRTNVTES